MKQRTVVLLSLAGGVFGFWLAGMIQLGFWVAHSIELDRMLLTPDPMLAVETQLRRMPARPLEPDTALSALETKTAPDPNVVSLEPVLITGAMRSRAMPPPRTTAPAPVLQPDVAPPSVTPLSLPLPLPIAPLELPEPDPDSGLRLAPES